MKFGIRLFALGIGLVLSRESCAQTALEADLLGSNEAGPAWTGAGAVALLVVEGAKDAVTITPGEPAETTTANYLQPRSIEPMAVHIHRGAAGVDGRVVVEFPWTSWRSGPSITVTGQAPKGFGSKVAANPQGYYVDVHTSAFPAGAARGQLHAPIAREGLAVIPSPPLRSPAAIKSIGAPGGGWFPVAPGAPFPGVVPGARTAPRPPTPPSRMTWEFVFRHFTRDDERAAGLLETEVPILRQVANDCELALDALSLQQADERPGVIDEHIARLRSGLGLAAFGSLESYVRRTFESDDDGPDSSAPPSRAPRIDQTLVFPPPPSKLYRDPDFTLKASSTSGLRVYYTATGDCSVRGPTVRILSAGSCWLTAHQPGNERFNAAPDVVQRLMIGKASQGISVPTIGARTYRDPDFPVGASASSGLPVVVGADGNCSVDRGVVHLLGAGTCFLTAHQPGSPDYTAAPIVDREFAIAKADQTISIPAFEAPLYGPGDLWLGPRASSGLPVRISTEGMCTFTGTHLRILGSGTCKVIADQPGNENYNAAPTETRVFAVWYDPASAPGAGADEL